MFYQLPLNMDFYGHIFSSNGVIAFNIVDDNSYSLAKDLIDNINGHSKRKYRNVYYKEGCIYIDNKPILVVRGFGFLIGTGGLNLTFEEAAKIQDDLCDWVVAILKGIS